MIWLIVLFLVTGFLVACYACCACPSGQLDNAFRDVVDWHDIPPEDLYRMEKGLKRVEEK
jgi:hypothetical protein